MQAATFLFCVWTKTQLRVHCFHSEEEIAGVDRHFVLPKGNFIHLLLLLLCCLFVCVVIVVVVAVSAGAGLPGLHIVGVPQR